MVHLGQAIRMRCYNPGLITAIFLFLPVGGAALWAMHSGTGISPSFDVLGFGVALAIHLAIMLHVALGLRRSS